MTLGDVVYRFGFGESNSTITSNSRGLMARSVINRKQKSSNIFEADNGHNYWSLLHGEFPWCLDDSEETGGSGTGGRRK